MLSHISKSCHAVISGLGGQTKGGDVGDAALGAEVVRGGGEANQKVNFLNDPRSVLLGGFIFTMIKL